MGNFNILGFIEASISLQSGVAEDFSFFKPDLFSALPEQQKPGQWGGQIAVGF